MGYKVTDQQVDTTALSLMYPRDLLAKLRNDLHEAEKNECRAMMGLGKIAVVNGLDHPATVAARREAIEAQRRVIEAGNACHEQYEQEAVEGKW